MKNLFIKIWKSVILQFISLSIIIWFVAIAANYPSHSPAWETAWGKFMTYIQKIWTSCPSWQGLQWYDNNFDKICVEIDEEIIQKYTVTFDPNLWSTPSPKEKILTWGEVIWAFPTVSRSWYNFLWWFTTKTWGTQVNSFTIINSNITYYAQWGIIWECWSANWVTTISIPSSNLCNKWDASSVISNNTSFNWTCWNTANCSAPRQYKIFFHLNWGRCTSSSRIEDYDESNVGYMTAYTHPSWYDAWFRNYYIVVKSNSLLWELPSFDEYWNYFIRYNKWHIYLDKWNIKWWYTKPEWGIEVNSTSIFNEKLIQEITWNTLYARWYWKVNFYYNYDTKNAPNSSSKEVLNNTAIWALPTITRNWYTFNGWYTNEDRWTKIDENTIINDSVTYYAQWTLNTVKTDWVCWEANWVARYSSYINSSILCDVWESTSIVSNNSNYTWNCISNDWWNTANCSAPRQYTVTFDSKWWNKAIPSSKYVLYNTAIWELPIVTKDWYNFKGWYDFSLNWEINPIKTDTLITKNISLWALWISKINSVYTSWSHTCILSSWNLKCWWDNNYWQLWNWLSSWNVFNPWNEQPVTLSSVIYVDSGIDSMCAITTWWNLYCWGNNTSWKLWDWTSIDRETPTKIWNWINFSKVSVWRNHTCAISNTDDLYCWWGNDFWQLWDWTTKDNKTPTKISSSYDLISAWADYTCWIKKDRNLYCWWYNNNWQIWDWTTKNKNKPTKITLPWSTNNSLTIWLDIWWQHTCAIEYWWNLYCWWYNNYWEVWNWTKNNYISTPVLINTWTQKINRINLWYEHTCAWNIWWEIYCWWQNTYWQLWDWTNISKNTPTKILTWYYWKLSLWWEDTCIINEPNEIKCWWNNENLQFWNWFYDESWKLWKSSEMKINKPTSPIF